MSSTRRWKVELRRTHSTSEYVHIEVEAATEAEAAKQALYREEREYLDWDSLDSDYDSPDVYEVEEIESEDEEEEEEEDSENEEEETPEEDDDDPPEEEVKF